MSESHDLLHPVLLKHGFVRQDEVITLEQKARKNKQTLFQYIHQYRLIPDVLLAEACASYYHLPSLSEHLTLAKQNHHTPSIQQESFLLPIRYQEKQTYLGISNPNDLATTNQLNTTRKNAYPIAFVPYNQLRNLQRKDRCALYYNNEHVEPDINELTHFLLSDAIELGASDCHIEPTETHANIRFRIDGLLTFITTLSKEQYLSSTNCIKLKANCDISIKQTPQDGHFYFQTALGFTKECRLCTCPTSQGEKSVIRFLDCDTMITPISNIGLTNENYQLLLKIIQQPQGLILVTGPTGSGKSMTLYSILAQLNAIDKNIVTVEDPIEIEINGINQTQIHLKKNLTFQNMLRTLLRQDPDIIMIGEIRDQETAEIAFHAAQTGHLVLATLHTNSTFDTITRLTSLNISKQQLCETVTLIIAQRLIRTLCVKCSGNSNINCNDCINGYEGRTGVFELLPFNKILKQKILKAKQLSDISENHPIPTLLDDANKKLAAGVTTQAEINRVIAYEN